MENMSFFFVAHLEGPHPIKKNGKTKMIGWNIHHEDVFPIENPCTWDV